MTRPLSILSLAIALAAACASVPATAQSGRDLASVLAEIDQGFICPQFRPDDEARRADMLAFSRALAAVGPHRISYRQAAYIRARMLERHNCGSGTAAMAKLDAAAEPAGTIEAAAAAQESPRAGAAPRPRRRETFLRHRSLLSKRILEIPCP